MPVYKKLPRSKPKKPDEFISFFDRLYHEAYRRGPAVLAVLGVLLLVIVGVVFWRQFHERKTEQLSKTVYDVSKKTKEEQEKIFQDIKKENFYAPLGIWASLELANRASEENNCEGVIKELDPYVGRGDNIALRALIYQKVGACLEDQKNWERAEEVYSQGWSDSKNPLRDWNFYRLAIVKKARGDEQGSKKILEEILQKDSPASLPVKEEAKWAVNFASTMPAETSPATQPVDQPQPVETKPIQ